MGRLGRMREWNGALRTARSSAVTGTPRHGLTLLGVDYAPDDELAARAERNWNVRQRQVDD
jgi:tRNA pseudouridine38-40 synthase